MKCAIILAGGKGTRMKANGPKVMCEMLFEPMISYVLRAVKEAGCEDVCVITGYEHEVLENFLPEGVKTAYQNPQLGTGHAVMMATDFIKEHQDDKILILNGDGPLMDAETINKAFDYHEENKNAITLVSALVDDLKGIGHIKRDENGTLLRIVEDKDANAEEKLINESNAGVYWFNGKELLYALERITNNNVQNEYYLTDSLEILINKGENVGAYVCENNEVILGANDRVQLNNLTTIMRRKINNKHMENGVDMPCTDGIMIGIDVKIGNGTTILPNTIIIGNTVIGENCVIGPNSYIKDGIVGNNVILDNVKLTDSEVGEGTKCAHLTYIGDSDVGRDVNFGCGTVTVNYDGKNKHRCKIGDHVFLGCNTNLIAPVEIGDFAFTAAGSTITDDVPTNALSIARAKQVNKEGWVTTKKPYKGME